MNNQVAGLFGSLVSYKDLVVSVLAVLVVVLGGDVYPPQT